MTDTSDQPQTALLIGLVTREISSEDSSLSLAELRELCGNLGIRTLEAHSIKVRESSPRYAMGSGKAEQIATRAKEIGCELIIFDEPLSPAQQRHWERLSGLTVIDRHEVILDIFAQRAHTKEAALQVELARLEYELPRLKRAWTHFSRQRGGGVTQRGEGETQLQLDRRILRNRIHRVKQELEQVVRHRDIQRAKRARIPLMSAAIVGYTNAGKSSLLNRLTHAQVLAQDKLFATLDPTTRRLALPPGQTLLLTDTVGFVRNLPHRLIEAFKATLEEAVVSDFLIHIVDCSSPEAPVHIATTREVMKELGAGDKPALMVYNKVDRVQDPILLAGLRADNPQCVFVSARTGEGVPQLLEALERMMEKSVRTGDLLIPHNRYDLIHRLHEDGLILHEQPREDGVHIRANLPERWREPLKEFLTDPGLLQGQTCLDGI